jgi:glycosyltransferase involved in cell wall biosynthesis
VVRRSVASWALTHLPTLVRTLRAARYDLVHVEYTPNLFGRRTLAVSLLPYLVTGMLRIPTVVTFHEIYTPIHRGLRNVVAGLYDRVKDTLLLWGSTGVTVTVPGRASRLSGLFPWLGRRVHTIPAGATLLPDRCVPEDRALARDRLGIGPQELVVGSFGLIHTDKRYELLFRVVRRLLDQGHRLRLLLIGPYSSDHPYCRYLMQRVTDLGLDSHVVWTGYGSPLETSRWLRTVDIYVMTDLRGASGRKSSLLSALAHGLPIVSTRGADTESAFVDGDAIVLADAGDEEGSLVHHLDRLLRDGNERSRLALRARELYRAHFAWEAIARRTIVAYGQCLSPRE